MGGKKTIGPVRTRGIVLVAGLSALLSIFRFIFLYMSVTGVELLEVEISSSTKQFIDVMFLVIGVFGFITAYGLYQVKGWGYWGTILLSAVIVVFDVWALTIQATAAMGLVLPVISSVYLLRSRSQFEEATG